MKKYKITVDTQPIIEKPNTDAEKLEWSNRVGRSPQAEFTLKEISELIGNMHHSWCHATFDPQWINNENFDQSQLLVLDIDKGVSPQEALERCELYEIPLPNIICITLSEIDTSELNQHEKLRRVRRYRMVWALDYPITCLNEYDKLLKKYFYVAFPEADHVPAVQRWLPGKETIWFNDETSLSPIDLMCIADVWSSSSIGSRGKTKKFKRTQMPTTIHNGMSDNVLKTHNSYSIYKEGEKIGTRIRNFDWEGAAEECRLFSDLFYRKRKITNPELKGLYSAMRRIEGGSKLWKRLVEENPMIDNKHLSIATWYNTVIGKGDNPWELPLIKYAPNDPATQLYERFTDMHFKRGHLPQKLKSFPTLSLSVAEQRLEEFIKEAIGTSEAGWHVCKAATAMGKTKAYIDNIQDGCLIAVPNHELKNEIAERMIESGKNFKVFPEEPELPERAQQELEQYRSIGDHIGAARFLKRMSSGFKLLDYGTPAKDIKRVEKNLQDYFSRMKLCINSSEPIITTHKRLLFTEFPNHHTYIIDEDIIPTVFEIGSFTSADLRRLIHFNRNSNQKDITVLESLLEDVSSFGAYLRYVQPKKKLGYELFEDYNSIRDALRVLSPKQDGAILPFFTCDHFIVDLMDETDPNGDRRVYYIKRHLLPSDKKYILMSATANIRLLECAFTRVNWCDISNVEHQGERFQVSDLSLSRSSLSSKHNQKHVSIIVDYLSEVDTISFKKYAHLFKKPSPLYFGKCSGSDIHNGDDIGVVGTPHVPTFVYRLMAASLGVKINTSDYELKELTVVHNGYKFRFMTFENESLRSIQFYFIESELIQATGRNRGLRNDSKCFLFSNFPLSGFEQMRLDNLVSSKENRGSLFVCWGTQFTSFSSGSLAS